MLSYCHSIFTVLPYQFHVLQLVLHSFNLVGLEPQGCKHQQEQQQHHCSQTGADSHAAPTFLTAPHPLLGRREGPAGYETRWVGRALLTSTSIHEEHLWERIALITAHGAGPAVRQSVCVSVASA